MLETSCEEGLQPEGAHCHHSETELNSSIVLKKKRQLVTCSGKIRNTLAFCLSFSLNFIGYVKLSFKSDWLFCFTVPFSLAEKKMRFREKNSAIRE